MGHFSALKPGFTAKDAAIAFIHTIVRFHGFFTTMVSDRDPIFLSKFWRNLFEFSGTKLHYSIAYHPQSNGQTEVVNRTVEHNQYAPHEALYGFPMPTIPGYTPGSTTLRYSLQQAQNKMQNQANKHRREKQFEVGQWVLLKIRAYKQRSVTRGKFNKFHQCYYGPYQIVQKVGLVAYRLKLPDACALHPVFHVSVLKEYHGDPTTAVSSTADLPSSLRPHPLAILARRTANSPDGPRS
ncbi:uncharacterized protein LOC110264970 [Arachis ipaensis]|uniref:uncharacterized protein LOC110264970 n=1 Tax=Arachis ipaensis TaxID=130454 RepID=UPI000A2B41FF|nr:uncharacterized protein LOC110264970 [Arachis ipaensis]XP_025664363.1 uncharacterized protein LOC112762722 [Arachis hypogaea]